MSSARQEILGRVRAARAARPAVPEPDWTYGAVVSTGGEDIVDRFIERTADYRATVVRVGSESVSSAVAQALSSVHATSVVGDLEWGLDGVTWIADDGLDAASLDRVDAVVTTATVAIANTGTIVLDHGPGQGRRALSLIPDVHVCVVESRQIVSDVPEAVGRLIEIGCHIRPLTWISGPSATSDIELDRVEGVHGPRTLYVIVVG
jgi:L-lactate dehydrogenase complex protein LldG